MLIFSPNIDQHFKHIKVFINKAKKNGLVISLSKISLFQTRIRFLSFDIHNSTITPIKRSIEFASKFPDEIKNKNQLQRFLRSLNYVAHFFQDLNILCEPLHQRLKKKPSQ